MTMVAQTNLQIALYAGPGKDNPALWAKQEYATPFS